VKSLRGRLTLSYATVVGVVLAIVSLLACWIGLGLSTHGMLDQLAVSVAHAEIIARTKPSGGARAVVARAIGAAAAPGIVVFVPSPVFESAPDGSEAAANNEPRTGADPRAHLGPRPQWFAGRPAPHGPPPRGWSILPIVLGPFLGLSARTVDVRGFKVVIAPDLALLEPIVRTCTALLLGAFALSMIVAWTIAAWLSGQALEPLITLTRELERFAAGDFATRLITTQERSELGALIAAYNGAAAQVASAFHERLKVEAHMRQFIADAGHALRTPLTVIAGYVEILDRGGIDDAVLRRRSVSGLNGETSRMRALIDRLLTLARLERPDVSEHAEVNVGEIAGEAIAHIRAARGGEIALVCPAPLFALADRAELAEAIENVVDNAVKYGRQSAVVVRVECFGNDVVVRVRDGGGGIPQAERMKLFERFFRGDERGEIEGTGLGLAITERAMRRCGGRIELEDGRPGNTTFALSLPTAATRALATETLLL